MSFEEKIRVIVADDSALMRKKISEILSSDSEIEVVSVVRDGRELVEAVHTLKPDVVTIDLQMPVLDGMQALGYIMSEIPTPCLMISAFTTEGANDTIKALEFGAVDFVTKPSGVISRDIDAVGKEIIEKVRIAAGIPRKRLRFHWATSAKREIVKEPCSITRLFTIASSTGGTQALAEIIPKLPGDFQGAILIAQHMPQGFTKSLSERLNWQSEVKVVEAEEGMEIASTTVIIARGGNDMEVSNLNGKYKIKIGSYPQREGPKPNADILMESSANCFGEKTVGIVLTGMGSDGTFGSHAIKKNGGIVITEDKSTCIVYGMPKSVVDKNLSDKKIPLYKIADEMKKLASISINNTFSKHIK